MTLNWRVCALVLVAVVLTHILNQISHSENFVSNVKYCRPNPLVNVKDNMLLQRMSDVAVSLHKAQIHVRGTKTSNHLRHAIEEYDKILNTFGLDPNTVVKRKIVEPKSVCPETYMGPMFDNPLYDKGFEATNCSHGKPISDLVTVVAFIAEDDTNKAYKIATDFADSIQAMTNINALITTKFSFKPFKQFSGNVKYVYLKDAKPSGYYWNKLISEVKTKYVLIARDVDVLTKDARFERLVREIEMLQVPVAAGSIRYPDGHWDKGCYQSVHRNFTLRYLKGYDESLHDCLFCDYVEGSFVASVESLRSIPFSELEIESGLFEDWFLQLASKKLETVVCPDAMFHVRKRNKNNNGGELKWSAFMEKWELYKVMPNIGEPILSMCQSGYWSSFPVIGNLIRNHKKKPRRALHPCRLDANAYAVKRIMDACDKAGIVCELDSGTLLGAVKFEGVLPWEMDADVTFPTENSTDFDKLQDYMSKYNLKMSRKDESKSFNIVYKDWRVEAWNSHKLHTKIELGLGKTPTKIQFNGRWSFAPRNPGLFARNRYGPEIYKHDLHWITQGKNSSWQLYTTGKFLACDDPAGHGCLDHYNGDGNLQFMDPLP